ncbi:hypothetical protein AgCh_038289 [Apium graveolens]
MEKAFRLLGINEQQKMTLAMYQLQGSAYDWWLMEKRKNEIISNLEENPELYTRAKFKKTLEDKYFPRIVHLHKERDFIRLQQGGRTGIEYGAEFAKLAKHRIAQCPNNPPPRKEADNKMGRGNDTKDGGIIPQWLEVRRWGHEASRYYPIMAREAKICTYGLSVWPDEDVRSLSGEFVTPENLWRKSGFKFPETARLYSQREYAASHIKEIWNLCLVYKAK